MANISSTNIEFITSNDFKFDYIVDENNISMCKVELDKSAFDKMPPGTILYVVLYDSRIDNVGKFKNEIYQNLANHSNGVIPFEKYFAYYNTIENNNITHIKLSDTSNINIRIGENTEYKCLIYTKILTPDEVLQNNTLDFGDVPNISKFKNPVKSIIDIKSEFEIVDADNTNIIVYIENLYPLYNINTTDTFFNYTLPDATKVEEEFDDNSWNIITDSYNIYKTKSQNVRITYPYNVQQSSNITLSYIRDNVQESENFTFSIKNLVDAVSNKKIYNSETSAIIRKSEFEIDAPVKKRLAFDISDIKYTTSSFKKNGTFTSGIYSVNNPLYTLFLNVDDHIPLLNGEPVGNIKYYVILQGVKHEILPVNKYDTNTSIPQMLVFDKMNDIKNTSVKIIDDLNVYSFQIEIEIEISTNSDFFMTPCVYDYECHVTDRKSFRRI